MQSVAAHWQLKLRRTDRASLARGERVRGIASRFHVLSHERWLPRLHQSGWLQFERVRSHPCGQLSDDLAKHEIPCDSARARPQHIGLVLQAIRPLAEAAMS